MRDYYFVGFFLEYCDSGNSTQFKTLGFFRGGILRPKCDIICYINTSYKKNFQRNQRVIFKDNN